MNKLQTGIFLAHDYSMPERTLSSLFMKALSLKTSERDALLHSCNIEIRRKVEGLLAVDAQRSRSKSFTQLRSGIHLGRYQLLQPLGVGGMGSVFLAIDSTLERRVAIKFLHATSEHMSSQLLSEGRAIAQCRHRHVIVVYDVCEYNDIPFMVLEYVQGMDLSSWIVANNRSKGYLLHCVDIAISILSALGHMHERGLVHCDLKPSNILVSEKNDVKILDFGLAHVLQSFKPHAFGGTPLYMAPEQWEYRKLNHSTDLWAFGILMTEMLLGEYPFTSPPGKYGTGEILLELQHRVGPDFNAAIKVIASCLQLHPENRARNANQLLEALSVLHSRRLYNYARVRHSCLPRKGSRWSSMPTRQSTALCDDWSK